MAKVKTKTAFFCKSCGNEYPKWQGQCNFCKEWNTLAEETVVTGKAAKASTVPQWVRSGEVSTHEPKKLEDIKLDTEARIRLADQELNRVLGGGLVAGAMVLFGGEPGIGKSTLMLQLALTNPQLSLLYVSGEESEKQIKLRADRISQTSSDCLIYTEINTQNILKEAQKIKPQVIVIDSIQTLQSPTIDALPGSISQIKECTSELMRYAKETETIVILIGHLTKEGSIAGPKVLEHMVDVVLHFEGDNRYVYRLLRAQKNRFGSTNELGIYEMNAQGLEPVSNPSNLLTNNINNQLSGSVIASAVEGARPLLIEVQALVSSAVYGTPQRSATGIDSRRLNMLLAVLEKRCGFRLGAKDVFLNLTGGLKIDDPSMDLAIVAAILSSNEDEPLSKKMAFCGEIGLNGEVRPSRRVDQRIMEAEKMGLDQIFLSSYNKIEKQNHKVKVMKVANILELYELLF
ncbi:MAG: DNA repair protein RadA [Flavobacteriales bacterium]